MVNGEKIGIGVLTGFRDEFYRKCLVSIPDLIVDEIVVVNDNPNVKYGQLLYETKIINNEINLGVGTSKNKALQYLLDSGCEHIFLIEDDIYIKDIDVFEKYIEASKVSGIQHLMFGYHGPANKNGISGGPPAPRVVINYDEDTSLALNMHCVGAFCYYSRKSLEDCGLIDERFGNAFDHVSHSYELAVKGYSTPYWWWADVANSTDYIEEQACSEQSSSIKTPETMEKWRNNIQKSMQIFKEKYGALPFGNGGVKDTPESEVFKFLKSKKNEN